MNAPCAPLSSSNQSPPLAAKAPQSPALATAERSGGLRPGRYARLRNHDYAGWGYYMVTFSTLPRRNLFSTIANYSAVPTPAGKALEEAWLQTPVDCPQISLREYAIMPDHFHGIVVMRPGSNHPLGYWINRVKGRTTHAVRKLFGDPSLTLWEPNFHDYNSLDAETFDEFRDYVASNPRRKQLREENRHLLRTVRHISHWRLQAARPDLPWDCLGDLALLDYPALLPVVVHRRISQAEESAQIAAIVEAVRHGAIPIGGFISPGEKRALQAIAGIPTARVIRLLPYGLQEYTPHGRQLESLAESRLLILSAFPQTVEGCHYDNCHVNNVIAQTVADCHHFPNPKK